MAAKASLVTMQNGIAEKLDALSRNAKDSSGFLNRVAYPMYQNAQIQRWMSENSSELGKWSPLNAAYALRKKRMYGGGSKYRYFPSLKLTKVIGTYPSFPGQGTKMLIAKGRLVGSVIGNNPLYREGVSDHRKFVTDQSLTVETVVPYAKYVAEKREFMKFSEDTLRSMRQAYTEWVKFRRTF